MTSMIRTRWAAIGAAVAVTVGLGGGFGLVRATISSGPRTAFVPITPCRLFKTNAPTVGPRTTPLAANDTATFQVTGANGDCTIPVGASAVVITLVGLNQTSNTYLTAFPADVTQPLASTMNLTGSATGATSSLATVKLSATGAMKLFNKNGTVNVIADITGYYEDHNHDDRYYTETETDAAVNRVVSVVATTAPTLTIERVFPDSETFSTPIAGRLLITKPFQFLDINCDATAAISYFLTLDNVPIASSAQVTGNTSLAPAVLTGITTTVVAAGVHTVGAAAECIGASVPFVGSASGIPGALNVLILN